LYRVLPSEIAYALYWYGPLVFVTVYVGPGWRFTADATLVAVAAGAISLKRLSSRRQPVTTSEAAREIPIAT
jgi:hypothetical protein